MSADPAYLDLLPPSFRESLGRCAVPQTFDTSTYDRLLKRPGSPDLDLLQRAARLEPVPDEDGRFHLPAAVREGALAQWWVQEDRPPVLQLPVPDALRTLAAELADVAHGAGRLLEELDLRLLHDPDAAEALFHGLYTKADRAHDLAQCTAILGVLDAPDRLPLLGPKLTQLRNDTATYLAARTLRADDYHRSARYVSRKGPEAALEALLQPDDWSMLQFYARGGMGKSLQLKWFMARRCAPAPARIPCSVTDFDVVHPVAAARHPWLLLLHAAAQLDRQIPGAPFQELLAAHGHYRALLSSNSADAAAVAPRGTVSGDSDDVVEGFRTALAHRPTDDPVVVVLDTFEEVFRPAVNPEPIMRLVEKIADTVPAIRFVFAGRYDLRDRLAERHIQLPRLLSHELEPLDPQEQWRYLVDVRGIHDEAIVQQISWLAEGLPLTLAIYANMVERYDGVTAQELAAYPDPGLQTAIQRVVARLPDQRVRWLLRYGVIPRQLSFDFVVSVMWPHLAAGMSSGSSADQPEPLFRTDLVPPETTAELREVWETLLDYTADYGWVTAVPAADAVQFRRELLVPMRRLTRPHEVHRLLQRDAAAYFERLATTDPAAWLAATREAVYHHLLADPDAGADSWRAAVATAREQGRDDWCLELAGDLIGRDFVDWQGDPVDPMTHQVLAEAQLERARAAIAVAESRNPGPEDPLWNDVTAGLATARQLGRRPDVTVPTGQIAVLDARLSIARGDAASAERLLLRHRDTIGATREMADVERALGQSLPGSRRAEAGAYLSSSYSHARQAGDLPGARRTALVEARLHKANGDSAAALAVLARARADGVIGATDTAATLERAWTLVDSGHATQAAVTASALADRDPAARGEALLAVAWAQLRLGRPGDSVASANAALHALTEDTGSGRDRTGLALGTRGLALADLHAAGPATESLLKAASRARSIRDLDQAARWAAEAAIVQLDVAGDVREAAQCLDEAERSDSGSRERGWVMTQVARARLLTKEGDRQQASAVLGDALAHLRSVDAPPLPRIVVAVETLAVSPAAGVPALLAELVGRLRSVTPRRARMSTLAEFWRVPVLADQGLLGEDLLRVIAPLDDEQGSPVDVSPLDLAADAWVHAEVLRACGRQDEAGRQLDAARAARGSDLVGWWKWLDAMDRLGPAEWQEQAPAPKVFQKVDADVFDGAPPPLAASCLVVLARRRLRLDGPRVTEQRLDRADAIFRQSKERSHWSAESALTRTEIAASQQDGETSLRWGAEAARILGTLGATVERDDVAGRFTLGDSESDTGTELDTVEVQFGRLTPDHVAIAVQLPHQPAVRRQVSTASLGDLATGPTLARIRRVLDPLSKGWPVWSSQIAERLLVPELNQQLAPPPGTERDVRLVFASRDLAALPWELCRAWDSQAPLSQGPGVKMLYRCLDERLRKEAKTRAAQAVLTELGYYLNIADGLTGPRTIDAVRRFQAHAGVNPDGVLGHHTFALLRAALVEHRPRRPLRVMVLRPDPTRQLERRRGDTASGSGLVGSYLRHSAQLEVIDDPTIDIVRGWVSRPRAFVPDVVHVAAPVRFGGGASVLDFGGDAGKRTVHPGVEGAAELSVSALSELVYQLMRGGSLPLLILDVPLPTTLSEALRALSARNSLAHQLMSLGAVQALLATGLADPYDQIEILGGVIDGLSAGLDVAEVTRRVHRGRPADAGNVRTALAFAGTALHLERSPGCLFPVWASSP